MKAEDLHTLELNKIDNCDLMSFDRTECTFPGRKVFATQFYAEQDSFDDEDEAPFKIKTPKYE